MAKKKRKRSSGGFFKGIVQFGAGFFRIGLKVIPLCLLVFMGVAAFLGMRQMLYADSLLTVQKVTVQPLESLSAIQQQHLQTQLYGKNILKIDLKKVAAFFQKDPEIQKVKVTRRFPGEITLQVQKRRALASIQFSPKGRYGLISSDGMILEAVSQALAGAVILEAFGAGIVEPVPGRVVKNPGVMEALRFLESYAACPLAETEPLTRMKVDALGNVSIVLGAGPEVRLGRRPVQRLVSFDKIVPLLENSMRQKIEYLDMQYEDVVVKQKKGF